MEAFQFVVPPPSRVVKGKAILPAPSVSFNPFDETVESPEFLVGSVKFFCVLTDPTHVGPFSSLKSQLLGSEAEVSWNVSSKSFVATFPSLTINVDGHSKLVGQQWQATDNFVSRFLVFCCTVEVAEGTEFVYQREFSVDVVPSESDLGLCSVCPVLTFFQFALVWLFVRFLRRESCQETILHKLLCAPRVCLLQPLSSLDTFRPIFWLTLVKVSPVYPPSLHLVRFIVHDPLYSHELGRAKVTLYSGCRSSRVIPTFSYLDDDGKEVDEVLDLPLDPSDVMFNEFG